MGLFDFFKRRSKADEEKKTEHPVNTEASAAAEPKPDTAPAAEPESESGDRTVKAPSEAETRVPDETDTADQDAPAAPVATPSTSTEDASEPASVKDETASSGTSAESVQTSEPVHDTPTTDASETPADQQAEEPAQAPEPADEPAHAAPAQAAPTEKTETQAAVETPAVTTIGDASVTPSTDATSQSADEAVSTPEKTPSDAERYDKGLEKSRETFGDRLNHLLANFRHVDESFFDDLEETLIGADVGYEAAMQISDQLRDEVKLQNAKKPKDVQNVVVEKLIDLYDAAGTEENNDLNFADKGPTVILFVGVNGVGKTTTIGKMANLFKQQGKKVLLAAADTFRAGAIEQLNVWAKRDGVDIVMKPEKSDPSAVVFDAVKKAKAEDYDILFVDTAGRLQNKANLMNELAKMKRVISREIPDAPHEVLLVLDSTTGQNALNQAKLFKETTDVTGIVLTKLDGTARGGIVLAIRNELHLPVKYVGLGEQVDDLRPFEPTEFVYGLFKGLIDVK